MIDSIIFDGEGVVVDTEGAWDKGDREFLRRRGISYNREGVKPLLTGRSLTEGTRVLKDRFDLSGGLGNLALERLEIVRSLFEREVKYVTGFYEFYEWARRTHKTCVATSMDEALLAIADRRLGLIKLFDGMVFTPADVHNRSKPDPDLLFFAASRLGSKPESCMVIEDAPLGIQAARRAHMRCIAITTTYDRRRLSNADLVVDSFAAIPDFISKLG